MPKSVNNENENWKKKLDMVSGNKLILLHEMVSTLDISHREKFPKKILIYLDCGLSSPPRFFLFRNRKNYVCHVSLR